ncbi:MAG TPA: hypothetical protein VHQ90_09020 [Thermoanaerobaculia bacterium]|nr:hypothetical protein [Thermoanaerobaculia bacterium]
MNAHRRRIAHSLAALALLAAATLLGAAPLLASTVVSCPFGTGGDHVDTLLPSGPRGLYVKPFAGTNLRTVKLSYSTDTAGTYRITLLVRRGTYDGPIIGSPHTEVIDLPGPSTVFVPVTFDFAAAPVSAGDTITFTHAISGPGSVFMNNSTTPCPNVVETDTTHPPLGGDAVPNFPGLIIVQDDLTSACIPSDTLLCIDNNLGDKRFGVTMTYSTSRGGGLSGAGQALPTKQLGVVHGGLIWLFGQDNPEVLVKVLNACVINGLFWVFITPGTDVGFSIQVHDFVTGHDRTYNNTDGHPATQVQDTLVGLPCS